MHAMHATGACANASRGSLSHIQSYRWFRLGATLDRKDAFMASSFDAYVLRRKVDRRSALKGAGAAAAMSAWGLRSASTRKALAQESVKDQILAIPGPGEGSPSGSDICLLYTSPSPRDGLLSRMPS